MSSQWVKKQKQESSLEKKLFLASKKGNVPLVESLLKETTNPKSFYCGLVYNACFNGHAELLEYLLGVGAPKSGALYVAIKSGFLDIVKLLIENGADVDEEWNDSNDAAIFGLIEETLFKEDEEEEDPYTTGETPLMLASSLANFEIVKILVEAGADISKTNGDGWSAIFYAIRNNCNEIVEWFLLRGVCSNSIDHYRMPILSYAGDLKIAKKLIEYGADPKFEDKNGTTILHSKIVLQNKDLINHLLQLGLDPHKKDNKNRTPFVVAVESIFCFENAKLLSPEKCTKEEAALLWDKPGYMHERMVGFLFKHKIKPTKPVKIDHLKKKFLQSYKADVYFLALARESPGSPFYKDEFPLDMLKLIAELMIPIAKERVWFEFLNGF